MIKNELILKLRKNNGFSQDFVADKIDVSRPTYEKIEKGQNELKISEAEKLANLYGLRLQDLLANKEEAFKVSIQEKKKSKSNKDFEIRVLEKDLKKFKQVLLYILEKVGAKPNVGETVIYKLLYFIDFDYYEKFEENLMGATYIKNHYGPTPVEFKKIVDKMQKDGELEMVKSKHFQFEQKKYLPRKSADLKVLSAQEISHIDDVLNRLSWKTAKELSDYSHTDIPWMIHDDGDKIRYESVFYRDNDHSVRNYEDEL